MTAIPVDASEVAAATNWRGLRGRFIERETHSLRSCSWRDCRYVGSRLSSHVSLNEFIYYLIFTASSRAFSSLFYGGNSE